MAPVLLLLATHVALALNSNRYNATDSSIKQEHVNYLRQENLLPANASYLSGRTISEPPPDSYEEQAYDIETQTWSSSTEGSNEIMDFKPELVEETTGSDESAFTTAQTYNKYIDPASAGDEPETGDNSINFSKADYNNNENNDEGDKTTKTLQNTTTSYYYQDLNSGHKRAYPNLDKHLKPSVASRKRESIKPIESGDRTPRNGKKAKINNNETLTSNPGTSGGEVRNCSLTNNETSPVNKSGGATREKLKFSRELNNPTDFNLIKSLVFEANDSNNSEIHTETPASSPVPVLSKLTNTLKPVSPGVDKTLADTAGRGSWEVLQVANTPPSYVLNKTLRGRTKDVHRQQNRSISSELIGTGLRFKSAVIKRAHSPPTNQSTPSAGDLVNDTARVFNTGLEHPPKPTNSFVITHHQGILNDSPSRETKSSRHISDAYYQVATVAPSPTNLYTETTREVSESYVNRFTKFPARENMDAVPLSPTSVSHPDTVHQKFQEGLKTKVKKSILQSTREPVTESRKVADSILNESRVNLNFENARSTPLYNPVKRNLVQVDTGLTMTSPKIYEAILQCPNCSNTTDSVSTTTFSSNSDTQGDKLGDVITNLDLPPRKILNGKNTNLSLGLGPESTTQDNFFTHLNASEGLVTVSTSQDKTEKSTHAVIPVSFDDVADEVSDIFGGLLMTTIASDEIVGALNVTADLSDNDTLVVSINSSSVKVISEFPWPVKKEAVVEGDLVLGGLMMVHEREDTITCGPVMPQGGIQALEAMLYSLDRLNEAPTSLLPNITLGAHILDDCDKDTYGLEMAVDFIKGSISNIDGAEYHCNKTQVRKVISGVVGAASSVTSIQVANLLRLFKIPQVSFFSTSPELSNKQRFEYFTRTIPSDHYQVKAMVDIVRLMGWSYISIIYEESNYGIKAFEELEDLLADYNICIAVKEKLVKDSGVADESAYDNIVQKLLTKPRARGTIIFGSDQEVAGVMRAVKRSNATGSFSWIGSDGWSARSLVSDGNEAEVEGTLSVQPQANPVRGFEEYFLSLNVENNRRNPWFVEFWEDHFQCRYPNSSRTPYNQKYTRMCTGKEKLSRQTTVFENQLQFVSDAVMAFAYAIRDMHKDLCHGRPGLCDAMKPTKGTELLKYLRKVDFEGLSGDRFHFDMNGDGPARYNIIHFKQVSAGKYRWIRVGEYVEGELRLNMSEIQFKLGHPKSPESVCSFPCDLGQAKKYVEGESCCWHCFNCTQYQIRHPTDPTQCVGCPLGTVPDPLHVRCIDIPEEYLRPESGWAIGAMALSSTGILITTFVVCVFIRYNDTPVVRASGRELSYVLLAGILMCYCVTFALVFRPTDIVCGLQRFGAGFCFTVVYAALLTKTNRISRIFNAGKHSAKRPSFISPRSQLLICLGLVGVQVLINGVWMVISPAKAMHHYPTREDNLLVCSTDIDASYMIAFTYPILLIVICTVYAVLTRKIPEAFNESKHIGFTMYTTCIIWLAFVPLYFGTANHVALRITSMSVTISLSASVTVACLFSPKLYIILIRPERNIRQSMMPMRYSAINKSSGTAGSGSMMAPVMVTAATCDQKQQIQKHVPPLQREMSEKEDTEGNEHKAKPQMIDCSTLTDPPPPAYSESVLNNTEEYLPKMNNNCSVGNGPLALLPGIQIKDLPL